MFNLALLADLIRIDPRDFGTKRMEALSNAINSKYANKVIEGVGLFICVFDLLHVGDSHFIHGDGAWHVSVKFRIIVLCPFEDELIIGQMQDFRNEYLKVALPPFFYDIFIRRDGMSATYRIVGTSWQYKDRHGKFHALPTPTSVVSRPSKDKIAASTESETDYSIAFKVLRVHYVDTQSERAAARSIAASSGETSDNDVLVNAPMSIDGRVDESALGMVSWFHHFDHHKSNDRRKKG